jgi:hypothetical protein
VVRALGADEDVSAERGDGRAGGVERQRALDA